ncbi:cytochrome P450 CYP749A22-like [Primulina eburnea]|uniref:cytochrome P450 CYP749A22-like n=1 Tax=Primulina eburnea TaxID=1245227 RepID=UPI003C6CAD03
MYISVLEEEQHQVTSLLSNKLNFRIEAMITLLSIFLSSLLPTILLVIIYKLWWIPFRIQQELESQGIKGPSYKFIYGNTKEIIQMKKQTSSTPMDLSHDVFPRLQPHLYCWSKIYGDVFYFWMGTKPFVVVTEQHMVKEILSNKEGKYSKLKIEGYLQKLLGGGIVVAEGEKWSKLRRLANHAFHGECLKDMVPAMISSARNMMDRWRNYEGKEIEVCEQFRLLTSEVISRTAFGSSYLEGIMIFKTLTKLCNLISRNAFKIRFYGSKKLIQTEDDIEADRIEKQLHDSILEIVKKREAEVSKGQVNGFGNDFLGSLLKVHHDKDPKNQVSVDEIIDECKIFYFAGQETTYSLLCWSILLLGIHTDWQEKARKEVIDLFGQENPNSEGIAKLKNVTMIIYETMRLYSPVTTITRRIERKTRSGKYQLPANVNLLIPPQALHRNPETWGHDAHVFKPERFSEGLAKSTNGNSLAFLPFGSGPRMCVGMNFTHNEAKIALSTILQRYKFTISPNYIHSPHIVLTTQPQHGVKILLQQL